MSVYLPLWLLGRHVTQITLTLQTINTDASLSAATTASLTGFLDEITITGSMQTENIVPLDYDQANAVRVEKDTTLDLSQILRRSGGSGGSGNPLATFWNSDFDIAFFSMNRGGSVFEFYGQKANYSEPIRQGKSTGVLTLKQITVIDGSGNLLANPTYAPV